MGRAHSARVERSEALHVGERRSREEIMKCMQCVYSLLPVYTSIWPCGRHATNTLPIILGPQSVRLHITAATMFCATSAQPSQDLIRQRLPRSYSFGKGCTERIGAGSRHGELASRVGSATHMPQCGQGATLLQERQRATRITPCTRTKLKS